MEKTQFFDYFSQVKNMLGIFISQIQTMHLKKDQLWQEVEFEDGYQT